MKSSSRLSNFEALRVLSMLMILLLHANYSALGWPRVAHFTESLTTSFLQLSTFELELVSVNVFVLISGWFGIRSSWKGLIRLVFLLFMSSSVMVSFIYLFTGEWPDTWLPMLQSSYQLWFILSYLALYMVSPVLNSYSEQTSKRSFAILLISFFCFQFLMFPIMDDFNNGYSFLSFMGLYLLARFLRKYIVSLSAIPTWCFASFYLLLSLCVAVILTVLALFTEATSFYEFFRWSSAYASPNVVLASVCLFLFFSRLQFSCLWINLLGAASLMVYATHQNVYVRPYYSQWVNDLHTNYETWAFVLLLLLFVVVVYGLCVLLHLFSEMLFKRCYTLFCVLLRSFVTPNK